MDDDKKINIIKKWGYAFIGLAILTLLFCYWVDSTTGLSNEMRGFVIIVSIWHLTTGLGVMYLTKWGFYLLKLFLYMLLLSFPIGTILAFKALKYMKNNNMSYYFGKRR
ncbi:MAG: hypothetical protein HY880_01310 [Deltaproteobacteria bacterium]|nr:hypothetical protein [Deltaproteobacteria bacterium]